MVVLKMYIDAPSDVGGLARIVATMAANSLTLSPQSTKDEFEETNQKWREMVESLPRGRGWTSDQYLVRYQGFWLSPSLALKGALLVQRHFRAQPTDIFLAAPMKCGTTWLRTLMFATMTRSRYNLSSHPLLHTGPHSCFPFLDAYIHQNYPITDLDALPPPRLFATHFPYTLFPESVTSSGCKFVYLWRDPKDVLVSLWHFMERTKPKELPPLPLQEALEMFCDGVVHYGPFWDHVLGYWKASLESPQNILFLKYEDLKEEPAPYLKKLAQFMGQPFTLEEEREGVMEQVLKLCSFENLSNLEVNKSGVERFSSDLVVDNREFFRKGKVGDWVNHLSKEMEEAVDQITEEKFRGSGLMSGLTSV